MWMCECDRRGNCTARPLTLSTANTYCNSYSSGTCLCVYFRLVSVGEFGAVDTVSFGYARSGLTVSLRNQNGVTWWAVVGVGSEGRVRDHILLTSIELEREEPGFDRRIT
jgi:hypothetical protein